MEKLNFMTYSNVCTPPCSHVMSSMHPPLPPCVNDDLDQPPNDMFYTSNMPLPPPPPQYNDSRPLCEIEADLCRKLSCGGQCHSQDSLNSGYSDEEDELEDEDGYYHIMPRKSATNAECNLSLIHI